MAEYPDAVLMKYGEHKLGVGEGLLEHLKGKSPRWRSLSDVEIYYSRPGAKHILIYSGDCNGIWTLEETVTIIAFMDLHGYYVSSWDPGNGKILFRGK